MLRSVSRRFSGQDFVVAAGKRYKFTPSTPLRFDASGRLLLFQQQSLTVRGMYQLHVFVPALLAWTLHPSGLHLLLNAVSAACVCTALHQLIARCRLVRTMHLLASGTEVEVEYTVLPFLRRKEVVKVQEFAHPQKPLLMWMWALSPIPTNISAVAESSPAEVFPRYALMKKGFALLPKNAEVTDLALLASVLNGIVIDTASSKPTAAFSSRFTVLPNS